MTPEPPETSPRLAVTRRRLATAAGAILLSLAALLFAWMGDAAQRLFAALVGRWPLVPLLLTPLGFAAVAWATARWVPAARGSGIPQVIAVLRRPGSARLEALLSLPAAAAKLLLTTAVLLVGGSAGREGPTVQVSAAIMRAVHRLLRVEIGAGVLIAGGAAGVAAAFNTPLAGVAFAIEELAAAYEQRVTMLVMAAVMVSGLVSLGIAGDYVYFGVMRSTLALGDALLIAPAAAIVGGALGALFSRAVLAPWPLSRSHPVLLAALCGAVVALIGIASGGLTWGTGYGPTRLLLDGAHQPLWFGPAKLLAALATAGSGVPGGIFAPSLAVGAGVGDLLTPVFPNDPAGAVVLLGMAGYFVGVVRAPLTAVIIISETTASRGLILPLFATALLADGVSALICRERLYHGLSQRFLAADRTGD